MKKIIFGLIGFLIILVAIFKFTYLDLSSPEKTCYAFLDAAIDENYTKIAKIYPYDTSVPQESMWGFGIDVGSSSPIEKVTQDMHGADKSEFYIESYTTMYGGGYKYFIKSDSWRNLLKVSIEMVDGKFYVTEVRSELNIYYKGFHESNDSEEDIYNETEVDKYKTDQPKGDEYQGEMQPIYTNEEYTKDEIECKVLSSMCDYWIDLESAISSGDFNYVKGRIYEGSKLYKEQDKLVNSLYNRGIYEEMIDTTILEYDLDRISDNEVRITTKETIKIIYPDRDKTEDYYYTYVIKKDSYNNWLPSEIKITEN